MYNAKLLRIEVSRRITARDIRIHLHTRIMKLTLINFDMNFLGKRQSDNETSRRTYALVKLGPQEVVHELARLFPLVHGLVLEDEI